MPPRKSKPVLKWRKVKGEWRAGPFVIKRSSMGRSLFYAERPVDFPEYGSATEIKSACESLANSILRACQTKGKQ